MRSLYEEMSANLSATEVVVSGALPLYPNTGEVARRMVRHGLADVLRWLGEDVGPKPDEATHAFQVGRRIYVSREVFVGLKLTRRVA